MEEAISAGFHVQHSYSVCGKEMYKDMEIEDEIF